MDFSTNPNQRASNEAHPPPPVNTKPIQHIKPFSAKVTPAPVHVQRLPNEEDKVHINVTLTEQSSEINSTGKFAGLSIAVLVALLFYGGCVVGIYKLVKKIKKRRSVQGNATQNDFSGNNGLNNSPDMGQSLISEERSRRSSENNSTQSTSSALRAKIRRSHSVSDKSKLNTFDSNSNVPNPKRSKSESILYNQIDKEAEEKRKRIQNRNKKTASVTFNPMICSSDMNLNVSTTSIGSKSSQISNSSKISAKSTSSRTSNKVGSSGKAINKSNSSQSLTKSSSRNKLNSKTKSSNIKDTKNSVKSNASTSKPSDSENLKFNSLPHIKAFVPVRTSSLSPRNVTEQTEVDSNSGSEPFYSMGGGEAPARAPGLTYAANNRMPYPHMPYHHQTLNPRQPRIPVQPHHASCLAANFPHNRHIRGSVTGNLQYPMDMKPARPASLVITSNSPPIPMHKPSVLPLSSGASDEINSLVCSPETPDENSVASASGGFDKTEDTGTIKRQKHHKSSNKSKNSEPTPTSADKPLKSVLKIKSKYDKPKANHESYRTPQVSPDSIAPENIEPKSILVKNRSHTTKK